MQLPSQHRSLSMPRSWGQPLAQFHNEMNRLMENFFGDTGGWPDQSAFPAIDIIEGIKHFEIRAELPGMDPDDIEVTASGGQLTIKGKRSDKKEQQDRNYLYSEISSGSFQRTIPLPDSANAGEVSEAAFSNGVLTVTIPKKDGAMGGSRKLKIKNG